MITTRAKVATGSAGVIAVAALVATPMLTGSASAAVPESGTFTVHAVHGTDTTIDAGAKGFSAGDEDVSTMRLERAGTRVGWGVTRCVTIRVGRTSADQLCTFALHFGRAQLVGEGAVRSGQQGPGTFSLAIVGGTGRYQHAHGQLLITATNGRSVPITVELAS